MYRKRQERPTDQSPTAQQREETKEEKVQRSVI